MNFDFGIARTQCNYISYVDEIFHELEVSSLKNLQDNLIRWSWTYLNRVNDYFAGEKQTLSFNRSFIIIIKRKHIL